ncbi:MAG: nucleotidyltransferase family protein [Anaerolineae bacterium]|nr:nucleotidyltransferase family protein [Anaerolineae bacterium]
MATIPTLDTLRSQRDDILRLAERYGISNIRVFGSVARGEARLDSDIDLLVDQDWTRLTGWGGMGFVVELEDLLGRHVDVATPEELKPRIRQRVLREAVPL